MAHGLENSSDMAYFGEVPWHSLGTRLGSLASAAEMMQAVPALASNVFKEAVLRKGNEVPGKYFTVREDTDQVLGVVGADYRILQNRDAFRMLDAITMDANGAKYETAGVLWGGRKVWALARIPEFLEVVPGDTLAQYLLISNSHDGSQAVRIMETPVRVVCANTLNMAQGRTGKGMKMKHTGDLFAKVSEVQDALRIIRQDFSNTLDLYKSLAKDTPSSDEIDDVLSRLYPPTRTERSNLQKERVKTFMREGIGCDIPGVEGSAWTLYNSITELVDHHANEGSRRADRDDMRLNSIWFGSGAEFKSKALETITDVCL
jgi:phage/plasmid-like protein (TIGR03299 family)